MQIIFVGNLEPLKKDQLIKFAKSFKAKVCFDKDHGMKIECLDRKSEKQIRRMLKELKNSKNLT